MVLNLKDNEYFGKKLKTKENPFFKLSVTCNEPDGKTEVHYHSSDYVCIQVAGVHHERHKNNVQVINPGDIVFRPRAYTHQTFFNDQGGKRFNIEFKHEWKKSLDVNLALPKRFSHYQTGNYPALYKLLFHFQNEYSEDIVLELIYDWLFEIKQDSKNVKYLPCVNKVKEIIENEIEIFHSLNKLSEKVFVHPVYLARAFKEKTGLSIGEYQIRQKLSGAIKLLLNSSLSIGEIAFRYGFYDDAHFIRSFNSVYKVSPHKFRLTVKS